MAKRASPFASAAFKRGGKVKARFKRGSGGEPHQQLPVAGKAGIRRHDRRPRLEGGGPAGPQPEWREPIAPPVRSITRPPAGATWDTRESLRLQRRDGRAKRGGK